MSRRWRHCNMSSALEFSPGIRDWQVKCFCANTPNSQVFTMIRPRKSERTLTQQVLPPFYVICSSLRTHLFLGFFPSFSKNKTLNCKLSQGSAPSWPLPSLELQFRAFKHKDTPRVHEQWNRTVFVWCKKFQKTLIVFVSLFVIQLFLWPFLKNLCGHEFCFGAWK